MILNSKRFPICILSLVALVILHGDPASADVVLYSNDFDGNVVVEPGVVDSISGGTGTTGGQTGGIVDSQGYAAENNFGGNFWRVTTVNDVLEFQLNNIPSHLSDTGAVEFSLAVIDSWDGEFGGVTSPDQIQIEILNGATSHVFWQEIISGGTAPTNNVVNTIVTGQPLAFMSGPSSEFWWFDDGYRMRFDNVPLNNGSLTFRISAQGTGFQGGNDESFAIDNLEITSAVPEPAGPIACLIFAGFASLVRRRRI